MSVNLDRLSFDDPVYATDTAIPIAIVYRMSEIRDSLNIAKGELCELFANIETFMHRKGEFEIGLWCESPEESEHAQELPYVYACPFCNRFSFVPKGVKPPVQLSKERLLHCKKCGWYFRVEEEPSDAFKEKVKEVWSEIQCWNNGICL